MGAEVDETINQARRCGVCGTKLAQRVGRFRLFATTCEAMQIMKRRPVSIPIGFRIASLFALFLFTAGLLSPSRVIAAPRHSVKPRAQAATPKELSPAERLARQLA